MTEKDSAGRTVPSTQLQAWLQVVVTAVLIPLCVFLIMLHTRVSVIESNRFTAMDGQQLQRAVVEAINIHAMGVHPVADERFSAILTELQEVKEEIQQLNERLR